MREAIPPWRAPAAVCALAAAGCRGTGRKCVGKALETVRRKATGLQRISKECYVRRAARANRRKRRDAKPRDCGVSRRYVSRAATSQTIGNGGTQS